MLTRSQACLLLVLCLGTWAVLATIGLLVATYVAPPAHWGMFFR